MGLDGANDPFCRKPFPWDERQQDPALLALYSRMAALRRRLPALRSGGCQVIYAEDNVMVFLRVLGQRRVLVAINRGAACEVVLEASPLLGVTRWRRREGGAEIDGELLSLPAVSASVWSAGR